MALSRTKYLVFQRWRSGEALLGSFLIHCICSSASVRRQTVDERRGQSLGPYFAEVPRGVGVQTEGQDSCLRNRAASCPSSLTRDISQVEKKRLDAPFFNEDLRTAEGRRFRRV